MIMITLWLAIISILVATNLKPKLKGHEWARLVTPEETEPKGLESLELLKNFIYHEWERGRGGGWSGRSYKWRTGLWTNSTHLSLAPLVKLGCMVLVLGQDRVQNGDMTHHRCKAKPILFCSYVPASVFREEEDQEDA